MKVKAPDSTKDLPNGLDMAIGILIAVVLIASFISILALGVVGLLKIYHSI